MPTITIQFDWDEAANHGQPDHHLAASSLDEMAGYLSETLADDYGDGAAGGYEGPFVNNVNVHSIQQ